MTLYKADLYNWVRTKHTELLDTKLKPLQEIKDKALEEASNELIASTSVDLDQLSKELSDIIKKATVVRDELTIHYGVVNRIAYAGSGDNSPEDLKASIIGNISVGGGISIELDKARLDLDEMQSLINQEIRKLRAIVETNPAKRALKVFKDLGFDMTDLETKAGLKKLELQVTDFNSKLFDLPEKPEVEEPATSTLAVTTDQSGVVEKVEKVD